MTLLSTIIWLIVTALKVTIILWVTATAWFMARAYLKHRRYLKDERYVRAHRGPELDAYTDKYTTIFFAGNGSSIAQGARYTGASGLGWTTSYPSIRTMISPLLTGDDDPSDVSRGPVAWLLYPIYLLVHAYSGLIGVRPYTTNIFTLNLAQDGDIAVAKRRILNSEDDIILYGCSRGAATAVSVLAHLPDDALARIKLVVLEGVFDSVEHVIDRRFPPPFRPLIRSLLTHSQYRATGSSPIGLVDLLPKNIPIVIITSRTDTIVHPACTLNLYRRLSERMANVHLITLNHSSHSGYATDDVGDIGRYYTKLMEIYARYL